MKLDFSTYPLNIYSQSTSKALLSIIEKTIPSYSHSNLTFSQAILSSFVRNMAGAGLLTLVDNISIGIKGERARKGLSNLIQEQTIKVQRNPSILLKEAQINLMVTSCVTDYLASLESESWSNGARNMSRVLLGILRLENPLNVIAESSIELCEKYEKICQIYFIAFLLNIYKANPSTKDTVIKLITESLCKDSNNEKTFSGKKLPLLFSDSPYKSLHDNLKIRINFLSEETAKYNYIYDPFIKWGITNY